MVRQENIIIHNNEIEQNSLDNSNNHVNTNEPILAYKRCSLWQKLVRHIDYIKLAKRN